MLSARAGHRPSQRSGSSQIKGDAGGVADTRQSMPVLGGVRADIQASSQVRRSRSLCV